MDTVKTKKKRENGSRINVKFTKEDYDTISGIAAKRGVSMSEVVREWVLQGLNGTLTEDNMEFIVPIIRQQLQEILSLQVERLAALSAKTCIQAGTSAYLTAEVISRFLPENRQIDYQEAYDQARKKAVKYLKGNGGKD